MDNKARHFLRNVLHKHGIDIIHEPVRLQAILNDHAKGQFKAEIYLWVLSATEGVADKLLKNNLNSFPIPFNVLTAKLSLQLRENFHIDKTSAIWVVDSWMFALNLTVDLNLTPIVESNFNSGREVKTLLTIDQTTKKLAVLFADICGSTSLYDSIGDDLARHFTAYCIKTMVSQISPYKGSLIKTIGDEILCTFPTAKAALNAACAMQNAVKNSMADSKQPLSICIGFHYGVVICEANDIFGDTVNVAAHVAGLAKADQIMTTAAVYAALPATLQHKTRQFKNATLKGKQEQYEIYWVLWKENNEAAPLPVVTHYDDKKFFTKVILKYIPQNTTYRQILQFIKPALDGGLFSKSGTIERISVLAQKDEGSDRIDFHAILYINSDKAAKRVINKLHRKQLNGRHIAVAEYIERSIHNDRRVYIKGYHPENKQFVERRNPAKCFRIITIEQLKDFTWPENIEA